MIYISWEVVNSLLTYSKASHPREGILLLRGKAKKDDLIIDEVVIPPLATHGWGFSSFPAHHLPVDFSVVGTAHSHPSGSLKPSTADLNNFFGRVMVVTAYPYSSERDIAIFDSEGKALKFTVVGRLPRY